MMRRHVAARFAGAALLAAFAAGCVDDPGAIVAIPAASTVPADLPGAVTAPDAPSVSDPAAGDPAPVVDDEALPDGWTRIGTDAASVALPEGWMDAKAMLRDPKVREEVIAEVGRQFDDMFAQLSESMLDQVEVVAIDLRSSDVSFATNLSIVVVESPIADVASVESALQAQYDLMDATLQSSDIRDVAGFRSLVTSYDLPMQGSTMAGHQLMQIRSDHLVTLTLTAASADDDAALWEQIMGTLRVG